MLLRGWTLALAGVPLLYGCYSGLVYCSGGAVWIVALVDVIVLLGFFLQRVFSRLLGSGNLLGVDHGLGYLATVSIIHRLMLLGVRG